VFPAIVLCETSDEQTTQSMPPPSSVAVFAVIVLFEIVGEE
jgi:hypothetical protein